MLSIKASADSSKARHSDPPIQKQLQKLRDALGDVVDYQGDASKRSSLRYGPVKRRMRGALEKLRNDLTRQGSVPILLLLVEYGLHLIDHGGLRKPDLSPATISKYVLSNASDLVHALEGVDPAELDPDDRALVYTESIRVDAAPALSHAS